MHQVKNKIKMQKLSGMKDIDHVRYQEKQGFGTKNEMVINMQIETGGDEVAPRMIEPQMSVL